MGNHKKRVERLEGGRKKRGFAVIIVHAGENVEEVKQKHLAEHPESAAAKGWLVINISGPTPPSAAPPPRPEAPDPPTVPKADPIQVTR